MSEVTMCGTQGCPLGRNCYRKAAIADPLGQSYAAFQYRIESEMREGDAVLVAYCDHQIKLNHIKQEVHDEQL